MSDVYGPGPQPPLPAAADRPVTVTLALVTIGLAAVATLAAYGLMFRAVVGLHSKIMLGDRAVHAIAGANLSASPVGLLEQLLSRAYGLVLGLLIAYCLVILGGVRDDADLDLETSAVGAHRGNGVRVAVARRTAARRGTGRPLRDGHRVWSHRRGLALVATFDTVVPSRRAVSDDAAAPWE